VYLYCLEMQKGVDDFLIENATAADERSNLHFHLATLVSWRLYGNIVYHPKQLTELSKNRTSISKKDLADAYKELLAWREKFVEETNIRSNDQISKNSKFVDYMKAQNGEKA